MAFHLRFPVEKIKYWEGRYEYPGEGKIVKLGVEVRVQGFLRRDQFLQICKWKTLRSRRWCEENVEKDIREITRLAFSTKTESIKIGVLRVLRGVEWPTASVLLHFCDKQPYPILDFRTLWSLDIEQPPVYTDQFWQDYTEYVRQLSSSTNHSMRTIDRALWQYSKEMQGSA